MLKLALFGVGLFVLSIILIYFFVYRYSKWKIKKYGEDISIKLDKYIVIGIFVVFAIYIYISSLFIL